MGKYRESQAAIPVTRLHAYSTHAPSRGERSSSGLRLPREPSRRNLRPGYSFIGRRARGVSTGFVHSEVGRDGQTPDMLTSACSPGLNRRRPRRIVDGAEEDECQKRIDPINRSVTPYTHCALHALVHPAQKQAARSTSTTDRPTGRPSATSLRGPASQTHRPG